MPRESLVVPLNSVLWRNGGSKEPSIGGREGNFHFHCLILSCRDDVCSSLLTNPSSFILLPYFSLHL